jgi:uncharacterized membrane-anchored protein YhcB (DUF1043 family)
MTEELSKMFATAQTEIHERDKFIRNRLERIIKDVHDLQDQTSGRLRRITKDTQDLSNQVAIMRNIAVVNVEKLRNVISELENQVQQKEKEAEREKPKTKTYTISYSVCIQTDPRVQSKGEVLDNFADSLVEDLNQCMREGDYSMFTIEESDD